MSTRLDMIFPQETVGGKAFRLAQLQAAGLPVKRGVVITADEVNSILVTSKVPRDIIARVAVLKFPVAVRSSAMGEDGSEHSWAGQFSTMLNVELEDLEQAILTCAKSRESGAAQSYLANHGNGSAIILALFVQEMVEAVRAGVLFTEDPTGRQTGKMVVEAVAGLGDSLVSGKLSPKRYVLDFETGNVVEEDGPEEFDLTFTQCIDLARFGRILRSLFEAEQDIEWAIDAQGQIFINQSRDVTVRHTPGLSALLVQKETSNIAHSLDDEQERLASVGLDVHGDVLSDQNIAELITPHPCQMAFGLFTLLFAHGNGAIREGRNSVGYDLGPELEEGFFRLVAGQPRCSIVHDALTYRIRGISLTDYGQLVRHYLDRIKEDPSLGNYPEVVLYNQDPSVEFLSQFFGNAKVALYKRTYEEFFLRIQGLEDNLDQEVRGRFFPLWQDRMREASAAMNGEGDIHSLGALYGRVAATLRMEACRAFVLSARLGFFAYARLRNRLSEQFPQEADHHINVLTSGIPLDRNPNLSFGIRLAALRDGRTSIQEVLDEFGHLAMHELEISVPRYRDQPELLEKLSQRIEGDPLTDLQENIRAAIALRERLTSGLSEESAVALSREIQVTRTFLSLREMVKFEYLKGYDLLRRISARIGRKLGWDDDLVFHLDPREMSRLDPHSMEELARERRALQRDLSSIYVPPVIFSEDLGQIGNAPAPTGNILKGIGVTNAIAEGKVVVLLDPNDVEALDNLRPGSILVTVTTDPAWSPILAVIGRSGGLITEVGGLLAHGAIYTREHGIAAVLNVPGATSILRTGMRVRVVGSGGYVEILE